MPDENKKILISWTAQEFVKREKNRLWFVIFGAGALILLFAGLLMKNYIFVLIVALLCFLVFIQALRHPQKMKIEISENEIAVNDFLKIPFKEIISFWIFENPEMNFLSVETKKISRPKIHLPLGQQSPEQVRQILIRFVKEKKQEESLIDLIAQKLKF